MWASYLLHKFPEWFDGALLAGGYPLWAAEWHQEKCACQLLQTPCQLVIFHAANDEFSSITNHKTYWQRVITAEEGSEWGQRAPNVKIVVSPEKHDHMEPRCLGVHSDKVTYAEAWEWLLSPRQAEAV